MSSTPRVVEATRLDLVSRVAAPAGIALNELPESHRRSLGQFFTPPPIAEYMAGLIRSQPGQPFRILDPGAGMGSLFAAAVQSLCLRADRPTQIHVTAVELDRTLHPYLAEALEECRRYCAAFGVRFEGEIVDADYLEYADNTINAQLTLGARPTSRFDLVITNPPYRKLGATSVARRQLQNLGIETSNWYAAFLALSALLVRDGGQLVAITPRSFCNGSYFGPFRRLFLGVMGFTRIHVLESRSEAFSADGVLQENVVFHALRGPNPATVIVSSGSGSTGAYRFGREIPYSELVLQDDPDQFIHLPIDRHTADAGVRMQELPCDLQALGVSVSTGRVVDFRARTFLRADLEDHSVPLIYPVHFGGAVVEWPRKSRKPNAIRATPETEPLLVPSGHYVLVRRFSAKEERRRIVACVFDPTRYPEVSRVGIENHLNFYHADGEGMDRNLAFGLAAFLNSATVDTHFRQFSGHTQVNAGDLRKLRYPDSMMLRRIGLIAVSRAESAVIEDIADAEIWGR